MPVCVYNDVKKKMYSLFHHFVQQFLRVQVKLYHYFDFSLCFEPHQRDTHTSGSPHSGPAFVLAADAEQNLPREKDSAHY